MPSQPAERKPGPVRLKDPVRVTQVSEDLLRVLEDIGAPASLVRAVAVNGGGSGGNPPNRR